jgi:hypothetical protein
MAPVPMVPPRLRVSRQPLAGAGLLALLAVPAAAVAGPLALAQSGAGGHSTTAGIGEALAPSGPAQIELGDHLRQQGYLCYGAWWCPACFRQKSLFGQQAGNRLPYVECDRSDEGRQRCDAAGIRAYPTWVKGAQRREGLLSLEELARWCGWTPGATKGAAAGAAKGGPAISPPP